MSNKYPGGIITSGAAAGYSVAFDGTGDYLSTASGTSLGAGNFTIECWVYFTSAPSTETTAGSSANYYTAGYNGNFVFRVGTTNLWRSFDGQSSQATIDGTFTWSTGQWYHMAWVRNSGTVTVYRNGVSLGSVADSKTLSDATNGYGIAATRQASTYTSLVTGYISNLRIVVGTALYTSTFTPPTQLLNVTNTSLLTCNSPAIVDQSSNAFAITSYGDAKVSTFTPFTGYTAYNPALGASTPGIWTVSDAIQARQTRRWNMYDPYFQNTTLLLHGNGTNGAQNNTFLDSSSNNFTITRNGNTAQGTFSPFSQAPGYWSNYFDGSSAKLTLPSNAVFSFGTGAYTVEFWIYFFSIAGTDSRVFDAGSASGSFGVSIDNTNAVNIAKYGTGYVVQSPAKALPSNQWAHVAVVRDSTSTNATRIYINGSLVVTGTDNNNWTVTTTPSICGLDLSTYNPQCYLSNLRVVKGGALYTSNFTPTTAPLSTTVSSGTVSLLTCQSSRFVDNSVNAFTITTVSTPSVQAFSPFYPTVAYTPQTIGGSGYVDGTGDYLTFTDSSNLMDMGGVNASIEAWVYPTTTNSAQHFFGKYGTTWNWSTSTGIEYAIALNNGSNNFYVAYNNGTGSVAFLTDSVSRPLNQWYWIVFATDTSNNLALFINGTRVATAVNAITKPTTRTAMIIGAQANGTEAFTGYVCGHRFISGSGAYSASSSTLTIPTTPPTTSVSSGTCQLLLNYTNAGIVDSTGKNVLETVGNAQISTTQSKFGGTSMSFPATNGNYAISPPNQPNLLFGTGQFTIELWVYPTAFTNTAAGIVGYGLSGGYVDWNLELNTSGTLLYIDNDAGRVSASSNLSLNTWTHIAVVRTSTAVTVYFNGTSVATYSTINNISGSSTSARLYVGTGAQVPASRQFIGYIDDLRITKGVARYTANFTPQTSQWQDQ
jgi:hypothetical protein